MVMGIEVKNTSGIGMDTSLGEHAYFAMPQEPQSPKDLTINGLTLDNEKIGGGGAFEKVMEGVAVHWAGFNNQAIIGFPDGREVRISTGRNTHDIDMVIWHRPGTETVCFEPVLGCRFNDEGKLVDNRGFWLPAGKSIQLETGLELL
jgi:hypothetical protein